MRRRLGRHRPPLMEVGTDPDYRFSLANERTFLAWVRTALALLAGGVAVVTVLPDFGPDGSRHLLGLLLMAFAGAVAGASYFRWERAERAMRQGLPLPPTSMIRMVASGVAVIATVVAGLVILGS